MSLKQNNDCFVAHRAIGSTDNSYMKSIRVRSFDDCTNVVCNADENFSQTHYSS